MPTFPKGHSNRSVHTGNARMIVKLSPPEKPEGTARYTFTPGDNHTLRGIPAIGRGVAGHIPGSSPSDAICNVDRDTARKARDG